MTNSLSRSQLSKISEGLLSMYWTMNPIIAEYVDIERFITDFLKLKIKYVPFAEDDPNIIAFLADGETPLMIYKNGTAIPFVFTQETIVVERFLLADKECGRRRFTLAHEAAHFILRRMQQQDRCASFHTEFDCNKEYSADEISKVFSIAEWQADTMAADLLMPRFLVERSMKKHGLCKPIRIYGDEVFSSVDKIRICRIAADLRVSYAAFAIRLRELDLLEHYSMTDFVKKELCLGGNK